MHTKNYLPVRLDIFKSGTLEMEVWWWAATYLLREAGLRRLELQLPWCWTVAEGDRSHLQLSKHINKTSVSEGEKQNKLHIIVELNSGFGDWKREGSQVTTQLRSTYWLWRSFSSSHVQKTRYQLHFCKYINMHHVSKEHISNQKRDEVLTIERMRTSGNLSRVLRRQQPGSSMQCE